MTPEEVVRDVTRVLELGGIQHSVVGDEETRGISGGQRKRVNIGMEMVADPSLLFLDEPTSGLDSTTTFAVVRALTCLSRKGSNVIAVLHQPSYQVFEMFDDVVFLAKGGYSVYVGPARRALEYFSELGFDRPPLVNPAGEQSSRRVHLLACLFVYLPVCLSACLFVYLPVCLSACLPACLSICLFVYLPACLPVCLSACLSICLPACLPACLSICRQSPVHDGFAIPNVPTSKINPYRFRACTFCASFPFVSTYLLHQTSSWTSWRASTSAAGTRTSPRATSCGSGRTSRMPSTTSMAATPSSLCCVL